MAFPLTCKGFASYSLEWLAVSLACFPRLGATVDLIAGAIVLIASAIAFTVRAIAVTAPAIKTTVSIICLTSSPFE
ncbi:MAG: hypothetical protein IKS49_04435 [Actinomycetaceae bacterium]|nr:hypothetical protein [Actinomycetaceae bacterium]